MALEKKNNNDNLNQQNQYDKLASITKAPASRSFKTLDKMNNLLKLSSQDINSGTYRTQLYRFLTDNIPVINSCIWTWSRLSAAPGKFKIEDNKKSSDTEMVSNRLKDMMNRLYKTSTGRTPGEGSFLVDLFTSLYRDGIFGGFITVKKDGSGVDRFIPVDTSLIRVDIVNGQQKMFYELDDQKIDLDRPDFYYVGLSGGVNEPLGRSILKAIPMVSYIEQQLVSDMSRTSHNSGYHRIHVKVTPPERMSGESDNAYLNRINDYFDSTVKMIRSCDIDENPVTWDNVEVDYIGPGDSKSVSNSWFHNHRSMVEEVCAGTGLAPFLLGYSYGATTTWSGFKFDVVMRQVRSVQAEVTNFLEWVAGIDLALGGYNAKCHYQFDNSFTYQAGEKASIESSKIDNIIKLYNAGLIEKESAMMRISEVI